MIPRPYVFINGRFIRHSNAQIAADDRGWRFGDGLFETISIHHGVPYQWAFHWQRLSDGLAALAIPLPATEMEMKKIIRKILRKNCQTHGFLRVAISRGVGSRGYRPHPATLTPSIVIESLAAMEGALAPATLWVSRWQRVLPSQLPSQFKLAQGMASTLALLEASEHKAEEALLLNPRGEIAEAASANLFWVKDEKIYTPALTTGCVRGSMRAALMRRSPLPVVEIEAPLDALADARAVWLTNGRIGIRPVAAILPANYRYAPHQLTVDIQQLLVRDKEDYCLNHAEEWQ